VEKTGGGLHRGEGVRSHEHGRAGTYRCSEAIANVVGACGLRELVGYGQPSCKGVGKAENGARDDATVMDERSADGHVSAKWAHEVQGDGLPGERRL
jgi:hypothetical protein